MLPTPVIQNSTNDMLRAPAHLTVPIRSGPLYHGGDLAWAEEHYPDAERPWIDLSTGINPWPYRFALPPLDTWTRLPAARPDQQLRDTAATYYGVGDPNAVAAAPGSQALIQVLPRLRPRGSIAIVTPTYGEYAACWNASGHVVVPVATIDAIPAECDVVVVANPNNPDGRIVSPERLVTVADGLSRRGGWLVVDEAFVDTAPQVSLAEYAVRPGLIVLRSFGKFFGLAGLRLGFALATPRVAGALRAALGPWAVSGPASWIGAKALADTAWIAATRIRLNVESARLDALLNDAGLAIVGGTALFRSVESAAAAQLFDRLCQRGIFVRRFLERPERLRLGLPPDDAATERLRRVLLASRREEQK
jgi:cobalamin biosynthesis protein CobC